MNSFYLVFEYIENTNVNFSSRSKKKSKLTGVFGVQNKAAKKYFAYSSQRSASQQ